jgi:outer membrane receptor protein involved in Fe transport
MTGVATAGLAMAMVANAWADEKYDPSTLPEIIVTAQKQKRTLEQTAASISALDGDFMREVGARGYNDLTDYTANASVSLSHATGTFSIRGFATPDTNPGFEPSVGVVVDGVYYGRAQFLSAFFHDIERFEVLRGPQGTLFGKNCTAGILNVVTQPPTDTFAANAEVLANGYGERTLKPAISMPLGAGFSARIAGNYDSDDRGQFFNTFLNRPEGDIHEHTTRARLRYNGSLPFTVDLEAFRSDAHFNNSTFQFVQLTAPMLKLIQQYDPRAGVHTDDPNTSANYPTDNIATIYGGAATVDYDLSGAFGTEEMHLTSVTGDAVSDTSKLDLDADFSPVPFIHDILAEPKVYRQFSQELRASGQSGSLFGWGQHFSFVGGLYYARSTFQTSDIFAVEDLSAAAAYCAATSTFCGQGGNPLAAGGTSTIAGLLSGALGPALAQLPSNQVTDEYAQTKLHQDTPTYAAFGSFEHFILDHWAIIGGLRYSVERKHGVASSVHQGALIPAIAHQVDHNTEVTRIEHDLSPKAGLKWQPSTDTEVYGTWAQGYKSGGFNGLPLAPDNLEYAPELATAYEFGAKKRGTFLGGPFRVSFDLFNTDFDNLQVSTFINNAFVVLNAASARSRGFETDLNWLPPLEGTAIYSSIGYAKALYKSYPNAPALADSSSNMQDLSGKPLSLAPRWTASLVPSYRLPAFMPVGATLAFDLLYRSSRFLDVDDDPRKLQPATRMYNARVTLDDLSRRWAVTVGAHNISNVRVYDQVIGQPLAPGNFIAFRTDRGRYYSVDLSVNL